MALRHPLSGRLLIDGTTGRPISYFDERKLLRVTYLPPGYRLSHYWPNASGFWFRAALPPAAELIRIVDGLRP